MDEKAGLAGLMVALWPSDAVCTYKLRIHEYCYSAFIRSYGLQDGCRMIYYNQCIRNQGFTWFKRREKVSWPILCSTAVVLEGKRRKWGLMGGVLMSLGGVVRVWVAGYAAHRSCDLTVDLFFSCCVVFYIVCVCLYDCRRPVGGILLSVDYVVKWIRCCHQRVHPQSGEYGNKWMNYPFKRVSSLGIVSVSIQRTQILKCVGWTWWNPCYPTVSQE